MEISILVKEVPVQCDISKTTTCTDVINMARTSTGYALYARGYDVERMVSMTTTIQKLIRSCGADKDTLIISRRRGAVGSA